MVLSSLFLFINIFFYRYYHVLTSPHVNPSSNTLKLLSPSLMQWNTMQGCMILFALERYSLYICCNHTQQWFGMVYELNSTFFDFIDDFLHYVAHLSNHFLCEGKWIWSLIMILFFFDIKGSIIDVISPNMSLTHFQNVLHQPPLNQIHCHKCANW